MLSFKGRHFPKAIILMEKTRKVIKSSADSWRMDETVIKAINVQLATLGFFARTITIFQSKYLNNSVELVQRSDHRFIKKITRPMPGFKSFARAEATLAGIELHPIIRKGQLDLEEATPFEQF